MQSSTLLFCSTFTLSKSPFSTTFCSKCHPQTARIPLTLAKRNRPIWRMEAIEGGTIPESPEDPPIEVNYFDAAASPEADPPTVSELPLFPLQMVVNPGTPVPLHIFELRYRLLFNRIRDGDSRFGIVLYDPESAALASIGCTAELTRFEPMPDGRIMTNNIGRERFRIIRIIKEKPYTRAMVEFLKDDAPEEDLSSLMDEVWITLKEVLRLSNKIYDKGLDLSPDIKRLAPGGEADKEEKKEDSMPEGWPSPRRVEDFSFAVCQVLDMPLKEQQILLQTRDTAQRLARQNKMLQTAQRYLAAQSTIKDAGLGKW